MLVCIGLDACVSPSLPVSSRAAQSSRIRFRRSCSRSISVSIYKGKAALAEICEPCLTLALKADNMDARTRVLAKMPLHPIALILKYLKERNRTLYHLWVLTSSRLSPSTCCKRSGRVVLLMPWAGGWRPVLAGVGGERRALRAGAGTSPDGPSCLRKKKRRQENSVSAY